MLIRFTREKEIVSEKEIVRTSGTERKITESVREYSAVYRITAPYQNVLDKISPDLLYTIVKKFLLEIVQIKKIPTYYGMECADEADYMKNFSVCSNPEINSCTFSVTALKEMKSSYDVNVLFDKLPVFGEKDYPTMFSEYEALTEKNVPFIEMYGIALVEDVNFCYPTLFPDREKALKDEAQNIYAVRKDGMMCGTLTNAGNADKLNLSVAYVLDNKIYVRTSGGLYNRTLSENSQEISFLIQPDSDPAVAVIRKTEYDTWFRNEVRLSNGRLETNMTHAEISIAVSDSEDEAITGLLIPNEVL